MCQNNNGKGARKNIKLSVNCPQNSRVRYHATTETTCRTAIVHITSNSTVGVRA